MNADPEQFLHFDLTGQILRAVRRVYAKLGTGFAESLYQNALASELSKAEIHVEQQSPIQVKYDDKVIGECRADLLVGDRVLVHVKAANAINPADENQLVNRLRACQIEVGILVNFGNQLEFRRKVFSNSRKMRSANR